MQANRLISPAGRPEDSHDSHIRPALLAEYIGQPVVKEQMQVFIHAARSRQESLDHTLIFGPPGLGKLRSLTSLPERWAVICVPPQVLYWSVQGI